MSRHYAPASSGPNALTRPLLWWKARSPRRRWQLTLRTAAAVTGVCALLVGLPALSSLSAARESAYELRMQSLRLAQTQDAGAVLRADERTPALLRHDWLRSVEYSLEREPSLALSPVAALERDRAALVNLETFGPVHLSRAEEVTHEAKCLATAIYYEARSERLAGQIGVAEVIMNRVRDHRYPNTICDVVYQGETRTTGCQFTFTCDGSEDKAPRGAKWKEAQTVASHVIMGLSEMKTGGATHYHATYVNPVWNSGLVRTTRIGTHIFYRFPRGSEWALASARQKQRLNSRSRVIKASLPDRVSGAVKPQVLKTVAAQPANRSSAPLTPDADTLNQEALTALNAKIDVPVAAAPQPVNQTASKPAAPARVSRRIIRRYDENGQLIEEREVPVTDAGAITPAS
ncbi:MAG: cell wall hydrolase [Pseudomonadota bacterium]